MEDMNEELSPFCASYSEAVEVIGRRWTGAILRVLLSGQTRFAAIANTVEGISDRLLSERLKELEEVGIVERKVTACRPVRIDYELTEKGRELEPVIRELAAWAERWAPAPESLRTR